MTNLFKETQNGESKQLDFDVIVHEGKIIVEFLQQNHTDNNKWRKNNVLSDVILNRYELDQICSVLDPTGEQIKQFIIDTFPEGQYGIEQIQKMAKRAEEVAIMLPTSYSVGSRKCKNTFLPLFVFIDGKDVSRTFQDFYVFDSDVVQVAFDALVNGNIPDLKQELVDFSGLDELHNGLIK